MNRIFVVILLFAAIASLVYAVSNSKKVSSMEEEINRLKAEKVELLAEHEECLAYKEQSLRKELVTKYLDSIMSLLNKMEAGYEPTKEETADFYDRIDFIEKNINSVAASKSETGLVITFIDSAKKTFETRVKTPSEKDKN